MNLCLHFSQKYSNLPTSVEAFPIRLSGTPSFLELHFGHFGSSNNQKYVAVKIVKMNNTI